MYSYVRIVSEADVDRLWEENKALKQEIAKLRQQVEKFKKRLPVSVQGCVKNSD